MEQLQLFKYLPSEISDHEFMLFDRIEKIKSTINQYGEDKFYLSFSGGKDSTLLHYLVDEALPGNQIPRVFINTGIEYKMIVDFVHKLMENDERFTEIKPNTSIKLMLEKYGYPFKSKEHSNRLDQFQKGYFYQKSLIKYIGGNSRYGCPDKLRYQFQSGFNLKISDSCCRKLKKSPILKWQKINNKYFTITGMRREEGGQRNKLKCIITDKNGNLLKFHPLAIVSDAWENWYLHERDIQLCDLYYPPYNFKRTGCKGCPFAVGLQEQLSKMELYLPIEAKQCEIIWKPVYEEYRRIGYRLRKKEKRTEESAKTTNHIENIPSNQLSLFSVMPE
jgi:3'-phosphoadenosine 5'-phosphosulfate sulfotransferase (PAPS reductase)/FAD synthetase